MGDDSTQKNVFTDDASVKPQDSSVPSDSDSAEGKVEEAQAPASADSSEQNVSQDAGSGSSGAFQDKTLTCKDCSQEFAWTAGEQDFYKQKGFDNPPSRCRICRGKYKAAREQFGRVESKITCKKCGKESTVPFVPRDPNTVLCRECFQAEKR